VECGVSSCLFISSNRKTESSRPVVASGILNDRGRYDNSSTETGVLVVHPRATVRPLSKEVRTITGGGAKSPTITISPGEARDRLLIQQQLISVYLRCSSRGGCISIDRRTDSILKSSMHLIGGKRT
ncbi:hypothetical protein AVEN_210025-1, partial [Araneus ventricosus]